MKVNIFGKVAMASKLIKISRANDKRDKLIQKHEEFDDYGIDLEHCHIVKLVKDNGRLYKTREDGTRYEVWRGKAQVGPDGLEEYVDQHCGHFEDDFYGTIWWRIPFTNYYIEVGYAC